MDTATENLTKVINGEEYVLLQRAVPLFDEHDEHDKDGKVVRRFDKSKLLAIANQCNNRARTTGDLAPWGPGHTKDDVKSEEDQPPVWGFYHNYALGNYGPKQKLAVVADCYVKRTITTNDGKKVDGPSYAKSFPRRSIELWPGTLTIDWVAHLRRSPQRDLGLLTYSRTGKLRYQMEPQMDDTTPVDDPTTAPAQDMAPEGHEDFIKHMDYAMKHHPPLMKFASMCGPTNAALPGAKPAGEEEEHEPTVPERHEEGGAPFPTGDEDEEALKNMRAAKNGVQPSRFQKALEDVQQELAAEKAKRVEAEKRDRLSRYERDLSEMAVREGILMDVPDEVLECATKDEKAFEAHKDRIRKNYQRDPAGNRIPAGLILKDPGGEDEFEEVHGDDITRYARDHDFPEKYGAMAFREAAKLKDEVLKYARARNRK